MFPASDTTPATIPASRESIVTELHVAEWEVAGAYAALDKAIAYRTRMQITLDLMDKEEEE